MFGSSTTTPFGTGSGFGTGTTFGGQTAGNQFGTGTGLGTSLFGNKSQTTSFGSTFGQPQSSGTTGLFGSTTATTGGSLFGGTTSGSVFGQQPTSQSSFGGFGSSGTGLFGNTAQSSTGTSVFQTPGQSTSFGSGTTSGFGSTGSSLFGSASKPTTGLFGTNTSTSLFGQTSTGLTNTSGFQGFGSTANATTGTPIKFSVVQGSDSMVKNGITTTINTRHQCISVMNEYNKKSLEELRIEDYQAGRKTGSSGTKPFTGLSTSTSTGGLFGTSGTGFANTSAFGQKTNTGFGTSGGSLFGSGAGTTLFGQQQQQQQQSTGLFGQKNIFGATPTSSTGTSFGTFGSNTTGGLFGQSTSGQTPSLFGQTTTSASTGLFGTQNTAFGQGQTNTSLFGQTGFGQNQQQQSSLFGAKPFGTLSSGTGGLFGVQNKQQTSGFNFGASTGGLGTSAFSASTNTSGGLFSAKPNPFGTGTAFGANTGTGLFGNTGTLGTTTGLGTGTLGAFGNTLGTQQTTGLGLGTLANQNTALSALQQQQQQQLLEQQLVILSNSPFGDSPLFRNSLVEKVKSDRVSTSTALSVQKISTTPSHYKVSPRPAGRIKPRPINNHTMSKAKLFEGLEEDSNLSPDTFVPRKNIKKLVIKNKPAAEDSPISIVDTTRVRFQSLGEGEDLVESRSPLPPSPPLSQASSPSRGTSVPTGEADGKATIDKLSSSDSINTEHTSPIGLKISSKTTRERLDDTITDLNMHRVTRSEVNHESSSGSVVEGHTVVEDDSTRVESAAREPCGITLKRVEYYTIPRLHELNQMVDGNGDVFVEDFVVGRDGFGQVKFYGRTNVAGLNLDEIVFFKRREIEVYPDSYPKKPPVGEELNKKAEITLEKVWPNDKTTHKPITSPERLKLQRWLERVEGATAKLGATFLDYNPDNGNWVFIVDHFTRYGMHEYLEDEQLAKKLKRPPIRQGFPQGDMDSLAQEKDEILKRRLEKEERQLEAYKKGIQRDDMTLLDQDSDSDMADIGRETFPVEMLEGEEGDVVVEEKKEGTDQIEESPASHQLAAALGMNAKRIQVMKASFFTDQPQLTSSSFLPKDKPVVERSLFSASFGKAGHSKSVLYPTPMPLGPVLSPKVQREVHADDSAMSGQVSLSLFGSPKIGVYPLRRPVHDMLPAAPPSPMLLPSAVGTALDVGIKVVGARKQFGLVPKEESLVEGREHLVGDSGLVMGRSFRVGWGPGFVLVHSGTPLGPPGRKPVATTQSLSTGDFLMPKPRVSSNEGVPPFGVVLEKLDVTSHFSDSSDIVLAQHQSVLEVELQHGVVSHEDGCPFFRPSPGVNALHHHAEVARKNKEKAGSGPFQKEAEQTCLVWDLAAALWGRLKEEEEEENDLKGELACKEDRESYHHRVARKEALSKWLAEAAKTKIAQEVDAANFQEFDHLRVIFSYLTGKQISRACHVAQQHGDHRLSLLLSQVTGHGLTRNLLYKQLNDWQDIKADAFINPERVKIFALLAGIMVWQLSRDTTSAPLDLSQTLSHDTVNVCKGLDWKRTLAVHLWYYCSPISSIEDSLKAYNVSFKGRSTYGKYGSPPSPPFMKEGEEHEREECEEKTFVTRDTCYHLLKLYCKRSHRLERLLSPATSTERQLDYRMSWHLSQVLESLEYTHISQYHAGMLHSGFASQLEGLGLWHWAAFVLLHIKDRVRREHAVRALLCRHCSLATDQGSVDREGFMIKDLKIPAEWIHEAKALRARYEGQIREEAFHLLKAHHWSLGHTVALRSLVSDAIINEEYDVLKTLLEEVEPRERCSTVKDWATGGQVFLDYIALVEKFQDIAKGKFVPTKYDLEDIHVDVGSLCTRISGLPCNTTKDMLCQFDMAKMCANFLKIVIKELADLTDDGDAPLPTHVLAPHVTKLPMPEDCSLAELRQLTPSYIKEIAAGY